MAACGSNQSVQRIEVERNNDSKNVPGLPGDLPVAASVPVERGGGSAAAPVAQNKALPVSQSTSEIQCNATTANPVIIATGEKVKSETDFFSQGLYAIGLTRTYRSKSSASNTFGLNWPSSFDAIRLSYSTQNCRMIDGVCYPLSALATEPSGAKYKYSLVM